jgi:hypothetical protein
VSEPELITILEGPTPDFSPAPHVTLQMVQEGPVDTETAYCELRTANGEDIMERCRNAWQEARPVKLDFPDEMRMRQQVDVVAARLREVPEGMVLMLWLRWPIEDDEVEELDRDEGEDDGLDYF